MMLFDADIKVLLGSCAAGLFLALYLVVLLLSNNPRDAFENELQYRTVRDGSVAYEKLPNVKDDATDGIVLSVVIPSYNETNRIKIMLEEAVGFLQDKMKGKWEIVIVDDGSSDGTSTYCLDLAKDHFKLNNGEFRVVTLEKNRGKGGAVRHGMLHIRGEHVLFADADGASKFADVSKLLEKAKSDAPTVCIGSRAHMVNTDAVVKRTIIRNFLMYSLHALVFIFGIRSINDTQCGFKLFNRKAVRAIFPSLHTEGWIFDVEILIIALRKNIQINELPISWHEVDGSKMDLARDSINMAKDLVIIRLAYLLGIYSDK
ncbi:unnamed protein product [Kluyveromyces dobzhanskii CBS 2104]|uniref:dolichyl-phosphate beta-glucosyltransferase n=1 Tax=Kluyveromyces dobzhanskii CBS 2104 TaxID=1427455 RepID=A0A0A8L4W4_9SACH|nr:unnamed protein product [Kluyveromyces dobzhanskii CBS 2104]